MTSIFKVSAAATMVAGSVWTWTWQPPIDPVRLFESTPAQQTWREADLWLAPDPDVTGTTLLGRAVELIAASRADEALVLLASARPAPEVAPYVELHVARALLALDRHAEAGASARRVIGTAPGGHLGESALTILAESFERLGQWPEAVATWQTLSGLPGGDLASVQLRLAQAAEKAGDRELARATFARLYYERPATAEARDAETALARFPSRRDREAVALELTRADRLYEARRFTDAHRAYQQVHGRTTGADRLRVELRTALCDVQAQRFARGLSALTAYLDRRDAPGRDEAGYFLLTALRGLNRVDYGSRVARFVDQHPSSPFAERALNDLATHFILRDEDGRAAEVFTEMLARYPQGLFADRAAWRAGWWAYRQDNYRETIRLFESAATTMRRADYRPAWSYWTARSYEALGHGDLAQLWYLRTIADYRNSYYGRQAARAYRSLVGAEPRSELVLAQRDPARAIVPTPPPSNASLVGHLLAAGLWDDAIAELRRAPVAGGSSAVVDATLAYALNRKGELRPAITAMRRAYPQFMAAGGELLPERMLKIIFPVAHWDTIRRHAVERQLDLYLVTALVAQESTFQADVVSSANAVGLMQLLPSTGRLYAGRTGVVGFTAASLTNPDVNVHLGTTYLSVLLARYDNDAASALAAYNAGEHRVDRWRAERPGLPRDEFIDDIPFPETQNYVKRILGTVDDYRLLYGSGGTMGRAAR